MSNITQIKVGQTYINEFVKSKDTFQGSMNKDKIQVGERIEFEQDCV